MTVERTFYCDWRECDSHTRTASDEPGMGFITVAEDDCPARHFCSWCCLLRFAGETAPIEVVGPEEPT
jgi:hypothetical protein